MQARRNVNAIIRRDAAMWLESVQSRISARQFGPHTEFPMRTDSRSFTGAFALIADPQGGKLGLWQNA